MDAKTNGEMPAMPCIYGATNGADGLTKREYFAAMAMQGLLASGEAWFCNEAVRYADDMLAELAKERT